MKLIIGLGNPGKDYGLTRHNSGYMVIDALQNTKQLKGIQAKKTDTFMNESGKFVNKELLKTKISLDSLYIIHDDLDLKLGEYKIQFGRGPKDHNGLKSIDTELGTNEYWHVRVGIDNRPLDGKVMGEEYVLQNFDENERLILKRVISEVTGKLVHS